MKIGSTKNFINRITNYITCSDDFDNNSHDIWLFTFIKKHKYNCYQIDDIIKKLCRLYNNPYEKYNGTGGIEFYKSDDPSNLCLLFNKLELSYKLDKIDVDELRNTTKNLNNSENSDINQENRSISENELQTIINNLDINNIFTLKTYQNDIREIVKNHRERLNHIVIAPTGCGKTVIFSAIVCDMIKNKHNKDIIILTKKKELLEQMGTRINDYIIKFINNNITDIKETDYKIIDCLNKCNLTILNKDNRKTNIYIVNWDKFTSSNKSDYKQVNWHKFSMMIIDESHWVGANEIYEMMKYIKNNTNINYLGFSATPVRCNPINGQKTIEIYGDKNNYNILYEYSYYKALTNKDICPIKYYPINISISDLDDNQDNQDDLEKETYRNTKILKKKSYNKVWTNIKDNIISKLYFKKGILWFRTRKEMLEFYNEMKPVINFKVFPTMSYTKKDDKNITKLVEQSDLTCEDFDNAIKNFLAENTNAILLSVMRATEGFDDDRLDFAVRMYYSNQIDPLNESQKMGRLNRYHNNKASEYKSLGYFSTLELSDNVEVMRQSLIQRFKSWITFAREYNKNNGNHNDLKEDKEKEIKKLINTYVDMDVLKIYEIDIEKDIIDSFKVKEFDKYKIKNALKIENIKRKDDKINVKSLYDEWAINNNYPICDELEEYGFNDFKWLFDMKEDNYLRWSELKNLCKKYQTENTNMTITELYSKICREHNNVPIEPEHFYERQFTNLNDLFFL